jgi:hypothetical protein
LGQGDCGRMTFSRAVYIGEQGFFYRVKASTFQELVKTDYP